MDEPCRGHNDPGPTLLDPLHMPYMAPRYPTPKAPDIVGFGRQWLSARRQNRQREMVIAAARRVAFGGSTSTTGTAQIKVTGISTDVENNTLGAANLNFVVMINEHLYNAKNNGI